MKITAPKKDLIKTLDVVTSSLGSGGSGDIEAHFVFRPMGKAYEVLGSNRRVFSSCPLLCSVALAKNEKPSSFTIEGKRLKSWLNVVDDEAEIRIKYANGTSTVTASTSKGQARFQSHDPEKFPYWDKGIKEVELVATLEAERFATILSFSKDFISDQEMKSPQICVAEIKEGTLWATNKAAACAVAVRGMEGSSLRFHGKDAASILSFLSTFGEKEEVEIHEHDRMLVLRRADGAIFGETRYKTSFPDLNVSRDLEDQHWWVVDKDEMSKAISFVLPSAAKTDVRLGLERINDTELRVSMSATTGDDTYLDIPCKEFGCADNAEPLKRFFVSYPSLKKALARASSQELRWGINEFHKKQSGWMCLRNVSVEGDDYLLVLVWMK